MSELQLDCSHEVLLGLSVEFSREHRQLREGIIAISRIIEIQNASSVYKLKKDAADLESQIVAVIKGQYKGTAEELVNAIDEIQELLAKESYRCSVKVYLLVYDAQVQMTPNLTLPHMRLYTSLPFLLCACEVWPDYRHPVMKKTLLELTHEVKQDVETEFILQGKSLLDFLD